ncbi:DUF397 domain-containing protein [Actinomadura rayongensis]|uniref:DUF397 domain-containing protein n=1 Tax=Actinomadura rayongensis TaxID=1429076 RepID=A0A6I4W6E4_9ACTN|nr:DUF397 domain-containing protein [Actinomadura rayongensis]MXQ65071.1 DUF397 domain-containing protein [Actinomadura rayongensis]
MTHPAWRKSSRSGTERNACVEVADLSTQAVGVRDSKNPSLGHLSLTPANFSGLLAHIKRGTLDHA